MDSIEPPPVPLASPGSRCAACGFDLTGISVGQKCPECGSTIVQFAVSSESNGQAVTALVLGIIGLATCFSYGVIGMPCAIMAIVFAKKAMIAVQQGQAPVSSIGMAKAGRICGWIGVALNSVGLLAGLAYLTLFLLVAL